MASAFYFNQHPRHSTYIIPKIPLCPSINPSPSSSPSLSSFLSLFSPPPFPTASKMKTLSLLGGTFYPSTLLYYATINSYTRSKLGGSHFAPIPLHSFDFPTLFSLVSVSNGDWYSPSSRLIPSAKNLFSIGAERIVICANVVHPAASAVQDTLGEEVRVLHVVDTVGSKRRGEGVRRVGLLAAKLVVTGDFYVSPLKEKEEYRLEVVVPGDEETQWVDWVIFNELGKGIVSQESRAKLLETLEGLGKQGVEAVVLACTDLAPLLEREVEEGRVRGVRVFDSTVVHAEFVAQWALSSP